MLRVTLLGNLGADPEIRYSQKGTQIVSFNVAVNQVRFVPNGERQENTEWFRIRSTRQIEYAQRLGKGTRVLVIGRLDIGHYQSKEGETRTSFDVWADEIQAMSSARNMGSEPDGLEAEADAAESALAGVSSLGGTQASRPSGRPARNGADQRGPKAEDLEDLPF
jgi:single-strand DNA-binding protein